jgi:hypothetical protein
MIDHVGGVRLRLWTAATNGPIFHPHVIYEYENRGGMIMSTEENWFVHQSSWQFYQQSSGKKKEELVKGMKIWPFEVLALLLLRGVLHLSFCSNRA